MLVHWVWYATLPNLSLQQKLTLLEHFPSPEDIFYSERFPGLPDKIAQALENKDLTFARSILRVCGETQVSVLAMTDSAYPSRLRNISDPPLVLYYKGALPDFEGQPVIGVVGARKATAYGMNNAREFSRQIARCGGLVVSGGAGGIDTAALQGAAQTGRQTVAVLGCGVNVVYPASNRDLFTQISKNGCLISEYPPDTEPRTWQFPERNRIISGLSDGVLVVEAPEKSGALITARNAFAQGRDVYAVPGNIGVPACAGSNALLQEMATSVSSGWDVLKRYADLYPDVTPEGMEPKVDFSRTRVAQPVSYPTQNTRTDKKSIDNPAINAYSVLDNSLTEQEKKVLHCLTANPVAVDDVIVRTGLPATEVLRILTGLALKGLVTNHPGRLVSLN